MAAPLDPRQLARENLSFRDTGGVSENNRSAGFRPAFRDTSTDAIYLSRFTNGSPAPIHLLDGLPDEVVERRGENGRACAAKATLVSGFVRNGRFYSREEAANATRFD